MLKFCFLLEYFVCSIIYLRNTYQENPDLSAITVFLLYVDPKQVLQAHKLAKVLNGEYKLKYLTVWKTPSSTAEPNYSFPQHPVEVTELDNKAGYKAIATTIRKHKRGS